MSYIGKAPGVGVRNRYYFTAAGGETSLSGTDDSGNTLVFSDGTYVDVALNGVILVAGTDYDTATANTIDNLTALSAGDVVEIVVYDVFSIASAVPVTGGTFSGPVIFNGELIVPRGTTAQRPASPSTGSIRFNTSASAYEGYDGTGWVYLSDATIQVEYLVIAGGGGGERNGGGGGGAGGYRSSVTGESSGGGASAESAQGIVLGTSYTITVGAGGVGGIYSPTSLATDGSSSVFGSITSVGGGKGGIALAAGNPGGSGGGGGRGNASGGVGTSGQGFAGGTGGDNTTPNYPSGGGGGAGEVGGDAVGATTGGDGGDGVQSSITGVATYRAGGGGGARAGSGGLGGGGSAAGTGGSGTVNTGSGGGAGDGLTAPYNGGAGGSGVIILKVPAGFSASFSAGVSQTSTTVGTDTVYTITAAGASDTVTFS